MKKEILVATSNAGKYEEIKSFLQKYKLATVSPIDLNIDIEVEETGTTLGENAKLKVMAFQKLVPNRLILADDRGLEISALSNEPGIYVRRWKDKKTHLTDEEILDYCLERMKNIPKGKRNGQFRSIAALAIPNRGVELFEGTVEGEILEKPEPFRVKGLPFDCLFYIPKENSMLRDARESHWNKAIAKAIPRIKELLK